MQTNIFKYALLAPKDFWNEKWAVFKILWLPSVFYFLATFCLETFQVDLAISSDFSKYSVLIFQYLFISISLVVLLKLFIFKAPEFSYLIYCKGTEGRKDLKIPYYFKFGKAESTIFALFAAGYILISSVAFLISNLFEFNSGLLDENKISLVIDSAIFLMLLQYILFQFSLFVWPTISLRRKVTKKIFTPLFGWNIVKIFIAIIILSILIILVSIIPLVIIGLAKALIMGKNTFSISDSVTIYYISIIFLCAFTGRFYKIEILEKDIDS